MGIKEQLKTGKFGYIGVVIGALLMFAHLTHAPLILLGIFGFGTAALMHTPWIQVVGVAITIASIVFLLRAKKENKDCCDVKEEAQTESMCHSEGSHGEHGAPGMSHGSAGDFLRRFWVVTFLLIPLLLSNTAVTGFIGLPTFDFTKWVSFGIATVIFGFALVFFRHAWMEIQMRRPGMMTLVSLAVASGYLFSIASTFIPALEVEFYLEISTLIWVLLFGHYLEAKSSSAAGSALQEVAKLLPKQAHVLKGGKEIDTDINELKEGDVVLIKPGEKIPADGVVIDGSGNVDESLISGESKPVMKGKESTLVAGSIVLDSALTIELTRVGEHSTIGQIQNLIANAQKTKPRSQRIADRAAAVLTFVAGTVAILTLVVWSAFLGESFVFAMTLAITVLVIACPHALGLAIPTVTTIATTLATKNGFFIKDLGKIETIRKADYVVFDKTGTLTEGNFGVSNIVPAQGKIDDEVLRIAASLEQHSSHVIGLSIVSTSKKKGLSLDTPNDFKNIPGKGISGVIDGEKYYVGNSALMSERGVNTKVTDGTTVFVATKDELIGTIVLADTVKASAKQAIENLHALGVKTVMLTGDNQHVARSVAQKLGIDTYIAEVLPEEKYKHIQDLQEDGSVVLMVGDGVNDAPALAQADAGIAIGAGTDVAVESGDVVLTRSNPADIAKLITLARAVYKKMIQNLVWALGYNVVAIPAAAGVFALWGFFLRPEIGALIMSLSTVIVVINALTLRRVVL
jgi:Cu2+-exporting ATPase